VFHVHAGRSNTIITLTDAKGNALVQASAGTAGFKKSHRGGPEAAYQAVNQLVTKAQDKKLDVYNIAIKLSGFGMGRDASYRAIRTLAPKWNIVRVEDTTPIPFNGCRPKKARRL
ncbi:MAG: hypothetical protein DHS80DRAFT_3305, partial [Piptocephalis tieghemiana]